METKAEPHGAAGGAADTTQQPASVPETWLPLVTEVGREITTTEDLEVYERRSAVDNTARKLSTLLNAWSTQQTEERALRRAFANWILGGLLVQMALVNLSFFAIGFKLLTVDKWVATSFILAVLTEIVAMANVVVKYLFPKPGTELLNLIEKL